MFERSRCVKTPKTYGEKTIALASRLDVINRELRIEKDDYFIYVPLVRSLHETELKAFKEKIPECEASTHVFPRRRKQIATFAEILEDKLPQHLLSSVPRSIDFVGEIAIIEISSELDSYKAVLGEAVMETHKQVRTVLAKAGAVVGTYRLRDFDVVAGEPNTETIHREFGCKFSVDVAKAYFSPRLSYEHNRIASLVRDGETIVDLFAGVGPFSILTAKTHDNVKVYSVDANPDAVKHLKKNVRLNRVEGKVFPIFGDARDIVERQLSGVADRVIMNLPEKAASFVDAACETIKPVGGIVHFYSFIEISESLEAVTQSFMENVELHGRNVDRILSSRLVRATAPYKWQVVLDAKIL